IAFANYYVISNFPGKMLAACAHWTTLSLIVDYLLVKRFWLGQRWSARLLLVRLVILVLVLGQDLTYTAGLALTSFTLSALFAGIVFWVRAGKWWPFTSWRLASWQASLRGSAHEHPLQVSLLILTLAAAVFLYVPLVAQVYLNATSFGKLD